MPPQLALLIFAAFTLWLFARDRKLRPMTSGALWISLLWLVAIGTKSAAFWSGSGTAVQTPQDYLEGNELDRNIHSALILAGAVILWRRRPDWARIGASNPWVFALFAYFGISVLWSAYPFVSCKRWIKDVGNLIMVLIILAEDDPAFAFRAVVARFTYLVVPFSVLFIKYYPDIGRYYNRWTWEYAYSGVATHKNELGSLLCICGMFLIWELTEFRKTGRGKTEKSELVRSTVLLLMIVWLLWMAQSSTATLCLILGSSALLIARTPLFKRHIRYLGAYCLMLGLLVILLYSVPGLFEGLVSLVGRDTTLTGRTEMWEILLGEPINPVVGTGYQSFWLGAAAQRLWETHPFHPNQAHNGYLETYLNGGLVGLFLLVAMIFVSARNLRKEVESGSSFGMIRFSLLFVGIIYNWSEAMFNRFSPLWFLLLLSAIGAGPAPEALPVEENGLFDKTLVEPVRKLQTGLKVPESRL